MSESSFSNNQDSQDTPLERLKSNLDEHLQSFPLIKSVRQSVGKEVNNLLRDGTLNTILTNLATGQTTLEESLQTLSNTANNILNTAIREEQNTALKENRANLQYRSALLKQQLDGENSNNNLNRKRDYILKGQVFNPRKQEPIYGLVVEAIGIDVTKDNFLGLDVTDTQGFFEIVFRAKDFKASGNKLPEVILQIGVEREAPLYITPKAIALQPREELFLKILLPEDIIDTVEWHLQWLEASPISRVEQINRTIAFNQIQHTQISEMAKVLKEEIATIKFQGKQEVL
ncbi:hypothetical protein A6770_22175 [Nostoc minutum NIES-26]|uniref:Uncharacterized protein n=1 Tax=Nostoc minutum NIES-26 TaxID=1844469 RepID=A0A367R0G3_9NOSO|nr:hypothetical protein A6770_22175 [Nostoc minutum NIES-26]